jgi:uncharacterized protein with WD repeat
MAEFLPPDLPVSQLLVRTKDSIQYLNGPTKVNEASFDVTLSDSGLFHSVKNLRFAPTFSPDGALVCYVYEGNSKPMHLCSTTSGEEVTAFPTLVDAEKVEFSPKGSYITTWSRGTKSGDTVNPNLRVWHVASGSLVAAYAQKSYRANTIQWSGDEQFAFRLVSNEVQIFRVETSASAVAPAFSSAPVEKVYHKGLTQYSVTLTSAPYISVAVFNPEAGGNPARVTLYRVKLAAADAQSKYCYYY